ncbi:MAG: hypothetical protein FJ125_04490, partial [Deltaproteobacteria bacterium]|nr:hypothetical protein [Deltaproteobacteria bacterium]
MAGQLRQKPYLLVLHLVDIWRAVERDPDIEARTRYFRLYSLGEFALEGLLCHLWRQQRITWYANGASSPSRPRPKLAELLRAFAGGAAMASFCKDGILDQLPANPAWAVEMEQGWQALAAVELWLDEECRRARNDCAHRVGLPTDEQLQRLESCLPALLRDAAARLGEVADENGCQVSLAGAVAGWLQDPTFAP